MTLDRVRRFLLPLATFLAGVLVLGAALLVTLRPETPGGAGVPAVGGSFALVDQDGRTVTDRDFRGAPFLVFFGYTHCPDVCPTTLFELSEVLRASGQDGERLRALFITVDPARDTPDVLKSYLSSFDPRIRGLSGSPEAIAAVEKAYKVYAKKAPTSDGDYTMDHSSIVYLMDAEGRFVGAFNLQRPPAEAARDLARYL